MFNKALRMYAISPFSVWFSSSISSGILSVFLTHIQTFVTGISASELRFLNFNQTYTRNLHQSSSVSTHYHISFVQILTCYSTSILIYNEKHEGFNLTKNQSIYNSLYVFIYLFFLLKRVILSRKNIEMHTFIKPLNTICIRKENISSQVIQKKRKSIWAESTHLGTHFRFSKTLVHFLHKRIHFASCLRLIFFFFFVLQMLSS